MNTIPLSTRTSSGDKITGKKVHTLVIGSGAAGLNAAVQLHAAGITDMAIVTEGLGQGTSINTGSDKQTYYKLSLCGQDADAPALMAKNYFDGGAMHGDLALVEASLSARAFLHLVNLSVPFPRDSYGQFIGYKTDHDPRQRATSIGPYTSREMCRALIRQVERLKIPVFEDRTVVELLVAPEGDSRRAIGALVLTGEGEFEVWGAENIVFAVGGPGGLYKASVYPHVHTGAIGLAMKAGACCQGLPESQYGMASTRFRWNVSGTYMQVIPRFISTAADGSSEEREFLSEFFSSPGEMNSMIFLKGYQWPFDTRKVPAGSSVIDILVYRETVLKGRRVYLDYRTNPAGFSFAGLSEEAKAYLENSRALLDTPIARLEQMNPGAIQLYLDNRIDLRAEPLEIAVCAQHNNGGLAANLWWESTNIRHLFPVGEVNGSHGIYRPGGSALNSGQVGAIRAAEYIANRYREETLSMDLLTQQADGAILRLQEWLSRKPAPRSWQEERMIFQARMSRAGAHIRSRTLLGESRAEAWEQVARLEESGPVSVKGALLRESLRNRQLCYAHAVYLEAIHFALESGVGSRGSALVVGGAGKRVHEQLGEEWSFQPEECSFREQVQETLVTETGSVENRWIPRRPLPQSDVWFETAWARYRSGEIYDRTE